MSRKQETAITQACIKWIKEHGGDAYHVHGSIMQRKGEPDIDGSMPNNDKWVHLKVEVKTPAGEPSPLQITRLRTYVLHGYVAGIVTSTIELEKLVTAYRVWINMNQPQANLKRWLEVWGVMDKYDIYPEGNNP